MNLLPELTGRARAPLRPSFPSRRGRGGVAPVGGRRDITLAPTEAAGRGGIRPGGGKCLRSDFDGSGRAGGSGEPPTTAATQADSGRVAATGGFLAAGETGTGGLGLDAVGLVAGNAPPAAILGPRRPGTQPEHVEPAAGGRRLDRDAGR